MPNTEIRWGETGDQGTPPEGKKDSGANTNKPESAEHLNWLFSRAAAGANLDRQDCLLAMPLLNDLTMLRGVGSVAFARSTVGTYIDRYGILQTAAIDEARFESQGLLIEGASTNQATYSADLTNGDWDKTGGGGTSAAKDATGRDGVASSASTLTADGVDGTCLQVYTVAEAEFTYSVALKRKTGTGTVEITIDGGATWVDVTSFLSTTDWYRASVTQTLTNPEFGIRLVTSGDEVEVDTNQIEALPFASSYIATVGSAVTRTADICNVTINRNIPLQASPTTILIDADIIGNRGSVTDQVAYNVDGETFRRVKVNHSTNGLPRVIYANRNFVFDSSAAADTKRRYGSVFDGVNARGWLDGVAPAPASAPSSFDSLGTGIELGSASGGYLFGHLANLRIFNRALSDAEMGVA